MDTRIMLKKLITGVLVILLALAFMPIIPGTQVHATAMEKTVAAGTSQLCKQDTVVMGCSGTNPITWKVLDTCGSDGSDEKVFLLSDAIEGQIASQFNNAWNKRNTFGNNYTSPASMAARACSSYATDMPDGSAVNLLTLDQAQNSEYGMGESADRILSASDGNRIWWTQTKAPDWGLYYIDENGDVQYQRFNSYAFIRPGCDFAKNQISVMTDANYEKGEFQAAQSSNENINTWKLTAVKGNPLDNVSVKSGDLTVAEGYDENTIVFQHSSPSYKALTLGNGNAVNVITAALKNSNGELLYYGSINDDMSKDESVLVVPRGLGVGDYTIDICAECWKDNGMSDLSTAPVTFDFSVENVSTEMTPDVAEITFEEKQCGYEPVDAQSVSITNVGNVAVSILEVQTSSFEVNTPTEFPINLNPAESVQIGIAPKESLNPGNYRETLRFKTDADTYVNIISSFSVKDHKWSEWMTTQEPNCLAEGKHVRYCLSCGKVEEEVMEALGHDFGAWETIETPTCTEEGYMQHTCQRCSTSVVEYLDPTDHDWMDDYTIDAKPTCTECGSKSIHCTKCPAIINSETIDATGHTYGDWSIICNPSCTTIGKKIQVCKTCGHENTAVIAAFGHEWGSGVITTKPTCAKAGVKTYICAVCNETKAESITKLNHTWKHIKTAAGLLKNGSEYDQCTVCKTKKNIKIIAGYATYYVKALKVAKAKRAFTVKWTKQSKANQKKFNGYQIRYSTKANMTGAKTITVAKSSKSKKVKKLRAKTKYYVQVRTYTKKKGTTFYSKWSTKKSVKTK